jgi:catechol 2,3-dioxygenase-like lactoylglutathione lyase family enzyme
MLNVLKLGHAKFEVQDVERMAEFYSNVIGHKETGRDGQNVYLSTSIDHHSIVLRGGASKTCLSKLAFQVAPVANDDLTKHFKDKGLDAEVRTGSQPAINQVVRTQNPDGVAIELYSEFQPSTHPYGMRGVNPLKLSHVTSLTPDVNRIVKFYREVMGFRFPDSMDDFFYFLRCEADHHMINLLAGDYPAVQHFAFELSDISYISRACDALAKQNVELLWGPLRHGCGHNIAMYHFDPEGLIIEHCAELDRMSNEGLGYFHLRPYHEDRPQYPKAWDPKAAIRVWGRFPPPELFGTGVSTDAREMTHDE